MFTKVKKRVGITELRRQLSKYFKAAKDSPVLVSLDRGKNSRVILDADMYNELIEAREDLLDSRELARLVAEDSGDYTSLDEITETPDQ